jgi:hypothetical protein
MERSRLRASTEMRYAILIPILEEFVKEGRIKMTVGKQGGLVFLLQRLVELWSRGDVSKGLAPTCSKG